MGLGHALELAQQEVVQALAFAEPSSTETCRTCGVAAGGAAAWLFAFIMVCATLEP
jgi:hypothetical protein